MDFLQKYPKLKHATHKGWRVSNFQMARDEGFEPPVAESESAALPLG